MFNLSSKYAVDNTIDPKTFIIRDMKNGEKERICSNLLSARLIWQITGEEIPSLINNEYNCSVIMGLEINLKSIKESLYFAELVQRMVKAPCFIKFFDHTEFVYSFAHKRLSRVDTAQVVILDRVETPPLSLVFWIKQRIC